MINQSNRRLTFGLVIDKLSGWAVETYYQMELLFGVEDFAKEHDINILCFVTGALNTTEGWEKNRNLLFNFIQESNLDGLIITPAAIFHTAGEDEVRDLLRSFGALPMVVINEERGSLPFVSINNYAAMKKIIEHVISVHGCREIAFIKGQAGNREAELRYKAYVDVLTEHHIEFRSDLVCQGDFLFTSGNVAITTLLDNQIKFDSLVASNDDMAMGAIDELRNRLGNVPDNLPITGFDDTLSSKTYSLTTMRQSFYEQAKAVSHMLLKIIHGEEVDLKLQIQAEMILRSSCGCATSSVSLGTSDFYILSPVPFCDNYQGNKNSLMGSLNRMNTGIDGSLAKALEDFEGKMISALYDEVALEKEHVFLGIWRKAIFWAIANKVDLNLLHDILSLLRKSFLPYCSRLDEVEIIENIFQQSRILISEGIMKALTSFQSSIFDETSNLTSIGEELISNLNVDRQMDLIYKLLPKFGINSCYVSIYENIESSMDVSKLILAFNKEKRNYTEEGRIFKTQRMLPNKVMNELEVSRYTMVVQALFHGEYPLGFAMFDFGTKNGMIYEYIRYRLSIALKSGLLFEKINLQSQSLEKQVFERTKELSKANDLLEKEVSIRRGVERQLKKALEGLEYDNLELKDQSLRDALTGAYNRRGFMLLAERFYANAENLKKNFFIMFADLDGLKQINDVHGHIEGDAAIAQTAKILHSAFRGSDIVARFGGDEFVVLIDNSSAEFEDAIRKRIIEMFNSYNQSSFKPYTLSICMGTAYFDSRNPIDFEGIMRKADENLYQYKKARKK